MFPGRRLAHLHDLGLDAGLRSESWRLEIAGLVRRPVSLGYQDVLALPRAHQVSTFHCVTGWTVKDVRWAGVRFKPSARARRSAPEAKAIRFVSAEHPYDDSLTLDQALLPDAMLALELDGAPLSRPHGAPARVVIPEMYGYKGVKWLERMELVATQPTGYWEGLGYDQNAWVGRSNGYWLSTSACRASRARSARCTGCTRRRSWSCSAAASASTCRASPRPSAGDRC